MPASLFLYFEGDPGSVQKTHQHKNFLFLLNYCWCLSLKQDEGRL
jgi:hypothetical protein